MREVFRLNFQEKSEFLGRSLVFVYLGKDVTSFESIEKGFFGVFKKFISKKN